MLQIVILDYVDKICNKHIVILIRLDNELRKKLDIESKLKSKGHELEESQEPVFKYSFCRSLPLPSILWKPTYMNPYPNYSQHHTVTTIPKTVIILGRMKLDMR